MLGKQINMEVPTATLVPFNDVVNILDGPETLVIGSLVNMSGQMDGYILMILGIQDAYELISVTMGEHRTMPENFTVDMLSAADLSVVQEVANILVGAYLSAICDMTQLSVTPSVPQLALDMVGAILSIVAIEYSQIGDEVLFLETKFSDESRQMGGNFFLIPNFESYKVLMNSLGM
jgi:chemotaxis protein CheC